ncbi:hypothetical protein TURU_079427 [Turdus rufiventris]|nr:hypothetical protein TURU_079427 [Turdus rufiventris]
MEMRTVAERKPPPPTSIRSPDPNHVMFSAEPDPATCTKAGWDNGIPHRTDRDQKELTIIEYPEWDPKRIMKPKFWPKITAYVYEC